MAVKKIRKFAPFLSGLVAVLNALIDDKISHDTIKGTNGIKVTDAGPGETSNLIIDGKDLQGQSGGIPAGYEETSITLCVPDGEGGFDEVPGKVLFKPDPPPP
jgi:hypothetical protein